MLILCDFSLVSPDFLCRLVFLVVHLVVVAVTVAVMVTVVTRVKVMGWSPGSMEDP
jgi:hypothetical protein